MRRAVLASCLLAATARAKRSEPQAHEFNTDVAISVAQQSTSAQVAIQYMWSPETLERWDEVVPALRRFVRHPSALIARISHLGGTLQTRSSLEAGGILHLLDGHVYGSALGGFERDQIHFNFEDVYWVTPVSAEVGARPIDLLSVGGYYRMRPILTASGGEIAQPSFRDGIEHELGGRVQGATPDDRLLAWVRGGWYRANWDYTGENPGPVDVKGWRAEANATLQSSSTNSWTLDLLYRQEDWDNQRGGDEAFLVGAETGERRVQAFEGDLGFLYWFRGTLGFRVSVGGGFEKDPPLYYEPYRVGGVRGYGRLTFGFAKRL